MEDHKMTLAEIENNKDEFFFNYGISDSTWIDSKLKWDDLVAIAEDFENKRDHYEELMLNFYKEMSVFKDSHSVKYRVKNIDSFIKKIIVKAAAGNHDINIENYMIEITDLIGLRVLYVFQDDYLSIHKQILKAYKARLVQNVVAKVREGDSELIKTYKKNIKDVKIEEKTIYRSIHYTLKTETDNDYSPRMEIQTRTIFDEAWSEIDHNLVYKNTRNNDNPGEFLFLQQASTVLGALSADCDKLASLMKQLHDEYFKMIHQAAEIEQTVDDIKPKGTSDKLIGIMNDFYLRKV